MNLKLLIDSPHYNQNLSVFNSCPENESLSERSTQIRLVFKILNIRVHPILEEINCKVKMLKNKNMFYQYFLQWPASIVSA